MMMSVKLIIVYAGLKFAKSPPRRSSIFATPQVAALGAVAALPAALPAVIAGGVEARGADINARVLPVRLLAPPVDIYYCIIECSTFSARTSAGPDCVQKIQLCRLEFYPKC